MKLRRPTPLRELHRQRVDTGHPLNVEMRAVIKAAVGRDNRYGSGDVMDLVLFVIDEMRRRRDRRTKAIGS